MMQQAITIGVIGHRDAIITEEIRLKINQFFIALAQQYPKQPIVLLSPLAIGADTVVTNIFLALKEEEKYDFHLHVPLPMPVEDYKTTFSEQDYILFEALCRRAAKVFTLSNAADRGKRQLFRQGAKYIIDNSRKTIVLWDGNPHGSMGGTADSVFYLKNGYYRDDRRKNDGFSKQDNKLILLCKRNITK